MRKIDDNIIATKSEKIIVLIVLCLFASLFVLYKFNNEHADPSPDSIERIERVNVLAPDSMGKGLEIGPGIDSVAVLFPLDSVERPLEPPKPIDSLLVEGETNHRSHHRSHRQPEEAEIRVMDAKLRVNNSNNEINWSSELKVIRSLRLTIVPKADPSKQKDFDVSGMSKFEFKPEDSWWTSKKCDVYLQTSDGKSQLKNNKTDGYFRHTK